MADNHDELRAGRTESNASPAFGFGRCLVIFLGIDLVHAGIRLIWQKRLADALAALLLGAVTSVILAAIFAAASRNRSS